MKRILHLRLCFEKALITLVFFSDVRYLQEVPCPIEFFCDSQVGFSFLKMMESL